MDAEKLARAARPAALGGYLKKRAAAKSGHAGHGGGHAVSVRTAEHNGHQIVLTTTYEIEVDGKMVNLPLMVDDAGNVHCHSLPNYQFDSAIDMIMAVIDAFPEDFSATSARSSKVRATSTATTKRKGRKRRKP